MTGGARGGRAEFIGKWAEPYDAATPQEEVAAAASRPPDGGPKRDGAAEVAYGPPARLVVGEQAELDGGFAPAWTQQCGRPRAIVVADEIESLGDEYIGQVVDSESGEPRA